MVSSQSLASNQHDGHSLCGSLQQAEQLTGVPIRDGFVDRGYQGHGIRAKSVYLSPAKRRMRRSVKKAIRRRCAIAPVIVHMKSAGKVGVNYLKGFMGDTLNALLCAVGHNIRMILAHLQAVQVSS